MKRLSRLARARPAQAATRDSRARPPAGGVERELTLAEMGARGDAVAVVDGARLYAPFTLPGERVRARILGERAEALEILAPSPDRVAPVCPLFGVCGGCQLQHWAEPARLAWKRDEVVRALARRRIEAEVVPTVPAWGEGRRRATLHAERAEHDRTDRSGRSVNRAPNSELDRFPGGPSVSTWPESGPDARIALGFMERGGARIRALSACPQLAPSLERVLPALTALAELFAPARGEVTLACFASETGIDVNVKGAGRQAARERAVLERAAEIAAAHDLARVSLDAETLVELRRPRVRMGPAVVAPPPGAFLQATAAGEEAIAGLALPAIAGAARVLDLFSGCVPFALRAAAHAPVHAVDSDAAMLDALKRAAEAAELHPVTVERRDLLRTPVAALEMKRFDAAIIDPPRAGARLQTEQVAASRIARVAAVSCDPATFARDARVLIDAGFRLTRVTPIDQFRWSAHVELVGAFER